METFNSYVNAATYKSLSKKTVKLEHHGAYVRGAHRQSRVETPAAFSCPISVHNFHDEVQNLTVSLERKLQLQCHCCTRASQPPPCSLQSLKHSAGLKVTRKSSRPRPSLEPRPGILLLRCHLRLEFPDRRSERTHQSRGLTSRNRRRSHGPSQVPLNLRQGE